jgi:hypothetical protein
MKNLISFILSFSILKIYNLNISKLIMGMFINEFAIKILKKVI